MAHGGQDANKRGEIGHAGALGARTNEQPGCKGVEGDRTGGGVKPTGVHVEVDVYIHDSIHVLVRVGNGVGVGVTVVVVSAHPGVKQVEEPLVDALRGSINGQGMGEWSIFRHVKLCYVVRGKRDGDIGRDAVP